MSDFRDFAEHNWGGLQGRVPIIQLNAKGEPNIQRFFVWPDSAEDMYEHADKLCAQGLDVYTTTALFKANRAMKSVVSAAQVVHVDDDGFTEGGGKYLLEPSAVVTTSKGHRHVYFKIVDTIDPTTIEQLAHSVSDHHSKGEGIDKCWAINHLYRVPGSVNSGYSTPGHKKYIAGAKPFVSTVEFTGEVYTVAEFAAAYPPVAGVEVTQSQRGELPSYAEALKSLPSSPVLDDLIENGFSRTEDRSDALHLLEQEIMRLGGSNETVFVIVQASPINKWADKPNGDEKLWQDILRARSKSGVAFEEEEVDADIVVTVAPTKKDKSIDFLTAGEKEHMASTFVDDYTAWASSKTDAAMDFHTASAFTVLSTVFSDYGHAHPRYGKVPLNLWFMILGETTRSRKSTTRDQMLSFVHALQDGKTSDEDGNEVEGSYLYDLGSDTTPEAMDNALLARPNRSALFHRDEIQGWLAELDGKSYMSGTKGKMTDLYGGTVSGKLRATGDTKRQQSAKVALSMYAMGIRSQVAAFLTQEDFQSGFLTRFIYVEADAPPRSRESDWVEQADPNEIKEGDPVFNDLVRKLTVARGHWDSFVPADGPTRAVPCKPEAWTRLRKFASDVLDAAEGHERHAIIEASADRLRTSILKAATLLAMYDCCDEVELPHMLSAINFCATWFTHMVNMANRVSESAWARRQDDIEDYLLERGGLAKWSMAYRKFSKDLKPREFAEVVQGLEEAGRVHAYWQESPKERFIEVLDVAQESAA